MAVNGVDNNYYAALANYLNSIKTNPATNTSSTQDTGASNPEGSADTYVSSILSQLESVNPGYLNYDANGTYAAPTLADYLDNGDSSLTNALNMLDGTSQDISSGADLTDFLSGAKNTESLDSGSSELDSVFNSLEEEMAAQNNQLIQDAIAKLDGKTDA